MDGLERFPSHYGQISSLYGRGFVSRGDAAYWSAPEIAPVDAIALCSSRLAAPMYTHERVTLFKVAQIIAEFKGVKCAGRYDHAHPPLGNVYFVPDDSLMLDEAFDRGIHSENALYGGVVPYAFVKTKAVTHDIVSPTAIKPNGWLHVFADTAREVVLPGYTVFSADDARIAGGRLLPRGPIRVKEPLGDGGYGQTVIRTAGDLDAFLENFSAQKLAGYGLVLETNLRSVVTRSVGHITLCGATIAYHGTQRTVTNNAGRSVYGGSHLVCVRGGWDALEHLPMDAQTHLAVVQARSYDRAINKYPGFFASRRNYDVGQGIDGQGQWRSGVFEASWRSGGASTAELAAFVALARDPTLQVVEASAVKEFGRLRKAPLGAIVHFQGDDPQDGPILRYTIVHEPIVGPRTINRTSAFARC
ncbi:MAG: DUF3182 family protein [Sphingobacteriales bacterium]|jgi:hypothetical protein